MANGILRLFHSCDGRIRVCSEPEIVMPADEKIFARDTSGFTNSPCRTECCCIGYAKQPVAGFSSLEEPLHYFIGIILVILGTGNIL